MGQFPLDHLDTGWDNVQTLVLGVEQYQGTNFVFLDFCHSPDSKHAGLKAMTSEGNFTKQLLCVLHKAAAWEGGDSLFAAGESPLLL